MKLSEQIMDAIGEIDESLLEKSEKRRTSFDWKYSLASVFAVLVLMLGLPLLSKNAPASGGVNYMPEQKEADDAVPEAAAADTEQTAIVGESRVLVLTHAYDGSALSEEELLREIQRITEMGFEATVKDDVLTIIGSEEMWNSFEENEEYTYLFREASE